MVKPDTETETALLAILERFCTAFAERDADTVLRLCAPDPDLVVVTSERPLLRGPEELRAFLDRYVQGRTTYAWRWDRAAVSVAGSVAWLLAVGTETAVSDDGQAQHAYRMTMVLERREHRWLLMQVHGSSPH